MGKHSPSLSVLPSELCRVPILSIRLGGGGGGGGGIHRHEWRDVIKLQQQTIGVKSH